MKYQALVDGEEMLILALIYEPDPFFGQPPSVTAVQTDGVTTNSVIPDFLQSSIINEIPFGSVGAFCLDDFECDFFLFCISSICTDP